MASNVRGRGARLQKYVRSLSEDSAAVAVLDPPEPDFFTELIQDLMRPDQQAFLDDLVTKVAAVIEPKIVESEKRTGKRLRRTEKRLSAKVDSLRADLVTPVNDIKRHFGL